MRVAAIILLTSAAPCIAAESLAAAPDPDEIIVTGRAQRLYRADETTVGRLAADPLDIPQSVQVINRQLIEDQGARDITDLYRNIAGVTLFSYSGVTFRGFRQDEVYFDGVRGNPFVGFSVPQLFNVEQVEVLKGPAGMLFGAGSPGGLINYVTKKPTDEFQATLRAVVGNYERIGGSAEVSGPIDPEGVITGRAGAFYEEMDSFRFNAGSTTKIGDGGLRVALSDSSRLTVQVTRYEQDLPGNRLRGVPTDNQGRFLTTIRWNSNEPTDFLKLGSTAVQARLDAGLGEKLTFDATLRRFVVDERQQYHEVRALLDTDKDGRLDTATREFRDQTRDSRGTALVANLVGRFGRHTVLTGVDLSGEQSDLSNAIRGPQGTAGGLVPALSLLAPVYGRSGAANYNLAALRPTLTSSSSDRFGVYLQEQFEVVDGVLLIAGARRDEFRDENRLNGQSFKDADWSFRGGAIYKPREDVSLYASYSQSFEPQTVANQSPAAGGPFPPVTGDQYEAGVKTRLAGGRLQANAAVYQIERSNLLQVDPSRPPVNGVNQLGLLGGVRSRGFEVDVAADLTPNWVLTFNYGYNDAKVTATSPRSTLTNAVGDRFANAPKHDLGAWTRYQVPAIRTAFALGAEYVSRRVSLDGQQVRPYAIADASIIHDLGPVRLLLRIDNIFDKEYAASGFVARTGHFPGEPRTVFLEARTRF